MQTHQGTAGRDVSPEPDRKERDAVGDRGNVMVVGALLQRELLACDGLLELSVIGDYRCSVKRGCQYLAELAGLEG